MALGKSKLKRENLKGEKLRDASSPGQLAGFKSGNFAVQGTIVGQKNNATSLRVRGLQHPSEGSAFVQSYAGIFHNTAYSTKGTLKTRVIYGANIEMDLEVQSPRGLLLTAVDDTQSSGKILAASKTDVQIHTRANAEVLSPKRLIIDRVSTATTGAANTSEVVVKTNAGSLHLNSGVVDGAVVLPSLDTTQRDNLTPLAGMIIYNTSTGQLEGYDGAWKALHA
jgi:hypothetical protein